MTQSTNQTDTSEVDAPIIIGFLYGIESDRLSVEEVEHRIAGFRHTKGYKEALSLLLKREREARHYELDEVGRCGVFSKANATNMAARLNEYLSDRHEEIDQPPTIKQNKGDTK